MLSGSQLHAAAGFGVPAAAAPVSAQHPLPGFHNASRSATSATRRQQQHLQKLGSLPLLHQRSIAEHAPADNSDVRHPPPTRGSSWRAQLLQRLPGSVGLRRLLKEGRKDSWRKQQEQLHSDKLAMAQVRAPVGCLGATGLCA
jgi:hypothetical protein